MHGSCALYTRTYKTANSLEKRTLAVLVEWLSICFFVT